MELVDYLVLASVFAGGIALICRYYDEDNRENIEITQKIAKRVAKWLHNTKKY